MGAESRGSAEERIDIDEGAFVSAGLTNAVGVYYAQAASVCLQTKAHKPGVAIRVDGDFVSHPPLLWVEVGNDIVSYWGDLQEATEHGAYGLAVLLVVRLAEVVVLERSWKGTGFDFWLGPKGPTAPLFQDKRCLEVSGIL